MSKRRSSVVPGARPTLTPATGDIKGTPASNNAILEPHADAIDDDPFELVTSLVIRIVYGKSFRCGSTGKIAFSARFPCPMATKYHSIDQIDRITLDSEYYGSSGSHLDD